MWRYGSYRSGSVRVRVEDAVKATASREVRRFITDMIEMAGGARSVALDLEKLGYVGRDGPYSEQFVRTWGTGAYTPSSDLLFALARYYELSLDEYAFGEPEEYELTDVVPGFQQRRAQLRRALRHALWELAGETEEAHDVEPPVEWPVGPPVGPAVASGLPRYGTEPSGAEPGIVR